MYKTVRMNRAVLVAILYAADRCAPTGAEDDSRGLPPGARGGGAGVRGARREAPRNRPAARRADAVDRDAVEAARTHAHRPDGADRRRPPRGARRRRADDAD